MAFDTKKKTSFADVISYCNETKSDRGHSPVHSHLSEINVETLSVRSKSPPGNAWCSPVHKEALELSSRKRCSVLNMIEKNWKVNIRTKIESDLTDQVQQALAPLTHQKRWTDKKKGERQKTLQMFKMNPYPRNRYASRFGSDSNNGGGGGGSFKYIDVNYIPQHRVLPGRGNDFYGKDTLPRTLADLNLPRKNGLPSQALYGLDDMARAQKHASNIRGGLDVTLFDSNLNFLSLPKHDAGANGLRPLIPNVIAYNGLSLPNYGASRRCFQAYTKEGMNQILNSRTRRGKLTHLGNGKYVDKRGVTISRLGPFWPQGYGPVCECPRFISSCPKQEKFLSNRDEPIKVDEGSKFTSVTSNGNNVWLTKPRPTNERGLATDNQFVNTNVTNNFLSTKQPTTTNQTSPNHPLTNQHTTHHPSSKTNHPTNHDTSNTSNQQSTILPAPRRQLTNHNNQPVITSNQASNSDVTNHLNNQSTNNQSSIKHNSNQLSKNQSTNQKNGNNLTSRDAPLNKVNTGQGKGAHGGGNPVWRGKPVIYDCDRSSRSPLPHSIPDGIDESLVFESRFESGNLRQVRRIAEYEYELVLRTDMYTNRHTQWYYFRLQKAKRNRLYKFSIINFLKKDSLYNYGMKPLIYSEKLAANQDTGWHRIGQNIKYAAWTNPTRNAILSLDLQYYCLEFEITLDWDEVEEDTIYLAHCYPYTYSDLRRHLDQVMSNPEMARHVKKEVLCETTAGNACFLLTITEFPDPEKDKYKDFHQEKKGVVITSRVHPGESQSSWMMKGVIEHLTSDHPIAKQLRKNFVFKIVPMLNPDGVIVGNYRTSLAARDLNRNYRHPKQGTFPTVWHTKQMVDQFNKDHPIILYCDLHGHSRKHMVFMYGCERKAFYNNVNGKNKKSNQPGESNAAASRPVKENGGNGPDSLDETRNFVEERMFPWLMYQLAPTRFSFHGTKFAVRRCKESTGRVVMFRQMGIWNSFTMEASFSGTSMNKETGRHFNIDDFMLIGRKLCECVLEYSNVCENPVAKSRAIMNMTREIAQQVLKNRSNLPTAQPSTNDAKPANLNNTSSKKVQQVNKTSPNIGGAYPLPSFANIKSTIVRQQRRNPSKPSVPTGPEAGDVLQRPLEVEDVSENALSQDSAMEPSLPPDAAEEQNRISNENTNTDNDVIDDVTVTKEEEPTPTDEASQEMGPDESCFRLLQSLNVGQMELESETSSESNSDSEPELPADSPSSSGGKNRGSQRNSGGTRKKKKKKRQQKYGKSISAPSSIQPPQATNKKVMEEQTSKETKSKVTLANYPAYVNKYANRSNGGIPIFAQERMKERAARRLAELKLAEEDRKQQESQLREQLLLAGIQDGPSVTYEIPVSHSEHDDANGYSEICGVRYKVSNQPRRVHYMLYNPYRGQSPNLEQERRPVVTMRFSPPSQLRHNQIGNVAQQKQYMEQDGELYMPYRVQAPAGRLSNQRGLSGLTELSGSMSGGSPTDHSSSQSSDRAGDDDVIAHEGASPPSDDRMEPRSVVVPVQKYNVAFKMSKQPWKQKQTAIVTSQRRHHDVDELDLVAMQQEAADEEKTKVAREHVISDTNASELFLPPSMDVTEVMTAHMRYPGQVHRVEAMRPLPRGRTMSRGPPMIFGEPVPINQKSHDPPDSLDGVPRQREQSFTKTSTQQKLYANPNRLRHHDESASRPIENTIHPLHPHDRHPLQGGTEQDTNKLKHNVAANSEPLFVPRFVALAPARGSNNEEVLRGKGNLTDRPAEHGVKESSSLQPSTVR